MDRHQTFASPSLQFQNSSAKTCPTLTSWSPYPLYDFSGSYQEVVVSTLLGPTTTTKAQHQKNSNTGDCNCCSCFHSVNLFFRFHERRRTPCFWTCFYSSNLLLFSQKSKRTTTTVSTHRYPAGSLTRMTLEFSLICSYSLTVFADIIFTYRRG